MSYFESFYLTQPHIHTVYGDGMAPIENILDVADELGVHNIVISDHDQIFPAILAKNLAARRNSKVRVYVGSEITASFTTHIVSVFPYDQFPQTPLPMFAGRRKTVDLIHKLNGIAILAHPLKLGEDLSSFDAVEVLTPFVKHDGIDNPAPIGSGDIHFINDPNWQYLTAHCEEDFVAAVRRRQTDAIVTPNPFHSASILARLAQTEKALVKDPIQTGRLKAIFFH